MSYSALSLFCFLTRRNLGIRTGILCLDYTFLGFLIFARLFLTLYFFWKVLPWCYQFLKQTWYLRQSYQDIDLQLKKQNTDIDIDDLSIFNTCFAAFLWIIFTWFMKIIQIYYVCGVLILLVFGCQAGTAGLRRFSKGCGKYSRLVLRHYVLGNPDEASYIAFYYHEYLRDRETIDDYSQQDEYLS